MNKIEKEILKFRSKIRNLNKCYIIYLNDGYFAQITINKKYKKAYIRPYYSGKKIPKEYVSTNYCMFV